MLAVRSMVRFGNRLLIAVVLLSFAGCTAASQPSIPVTVTLSVLPPGAGFSVWVWTRDEKNALHQPVSGAPVLFSELTTSARADGYQAVAFVPSDPTWTAASPPQAGHYAVLAGNAGNPGKFRVVRWLPSNGPLEDSNLPGEAPLLAKLSGTVTDEAGVPLISAAVYVRDEDATETDAAGRFELELQPGPVEVNAAWGETTGVQRISVEADGGSRIGFKLSAQTRSWRFNGRVYDAALGAGVAGAAVNRGRFRVPADATTDAAGRFNLESTSLLVALSARQNGYAWHSVLSAVGSTDTQVPLTPLPAELLGTWTYCHSRMRSGRLYVPALLNPPVERSAIRFRDDGFVENLPLGGMQGLWKAVGRDAPRGRYAVLLSNQHWAAWLWDIRTGFFTVEQGLLARFSDAVQSPDPDQNHEADIYSRNGCPPLAGADGGATAIPDGGLSGPDGGSSTCSRLDCIVVTRVDRGTFCGNASSLNVRYRNDCGFPVAVRWCLQRTSGVYDCGIESGLAAGATGGNGAWVCASTGQYELFPIRNTEWTGSTCRFPPPP